MRKAIGIFAVGLLLVMIATGAAFADQKNIQKAQPADAAAATNSPDAAAAGGYQDMPGLSVHALPDFLNDEDGENNAPSNIAITPESINGVDSVKNFLGSFVGADGKTYPFFMMGGDPALGRTTNFPVNIVAVDVVLLNQDGSVFANVPVGPFENLVLNSPNFQRADYSVGHVQFADAVQRAEFFNLMKDNWHTTLSPKIVQHVTVTVPFTVILRIRGVNTPVRTWFTRTSTDGNTVVFMLQQFFNQQFSIIGSNAIDAGLWTTNALNMQLFPNTFLFTPSATPLVTRGSCCVLGFHTFFFDNGTPEPVWVSGYASWTSPGTFTNADILDVLPLSHEISEAINDPFLNNITPVWQFPGEPGVCQGNLETGDPVEVTAHPAFPVTLELEGDDDHGGDHHGGDRKFTFHPQTEALVQWFTQSSPSNAFKGAFSYPDRTTLAGPALPCTR